MARHDSNVDRGYRLELTLNQKSQNINNNSSVVSYSLVLRNTINNRNNTFKSNTNTARLIINGSTVWSINSAPYEMMNVGTKTLASGNVTIGHNANGSKSFSFSASFDGTSSFAPQNLSLSGSMALTTIPRASKPTVSNSNPRFGNAITIYTNRASTSFTHTITYKQGNSTGTIASSVGASTSWTIPISLINNLGSATSGKITITVTTYSGSTNIGSGSITITATQPPPSKPTLSASSRNYGSSVTIYTNRSSSSYTHEIRAVWNGVTGDISDSVGTSVTWTVPNSYMNRIPNATSTVGSIRVTTKYGSRTIGTNSISLTTTVPSNVIPKIDSTTATDNNTSASNQFGDFVRTKSKLNATVSASGSYGSTIRSYRITFDGVVGTSSDSSFNVNNSGTRTINYEVTDSRGRKASSSRTINVLNYSPPTASISVDRSTSSGSLDATGTHARVSYNLSSWYVNGKNTHDLRFRYRVTGASSWTTVQVPVTAPSNPNSTSKYTANNSNYVLTNIGTENSYEFEALASDFFSTTKQTVSLPTGFTTMSFLAGGKGVAIGKVADRNGFEVAMPTTFSQGIGVPDTRDVVSVPEGLPSRAVSFDFKRNTSVGNPPVTSSGAYSHIINVAGWNSTEGSGGWPTQISVGGSGLAVRQATNATTWGSWKNVSEPSWSDVSSKPTTATRWPTWNEVSSKPATATRWPTWNEVTSKPAQATRWPSWNEVTGKSAKSPSESAEIPRNSNLNSYTTPGFYHSSSNADMATVANHPSSIAGSLMVLKNAGTTQFWVNYATGNRIMYVRNEYNGSWGGWREF